MTTYFTRVRKKKSRDVRRLEGRAFSFSVCFDPSTYSIAACLHIIHKPSLSLPFFLSFLQHAYAY